jgi:FlaA1/EpsC-like NDP-sugar epimerase
MLAIAIPIYLLLLAKFGLYRVVVRYLNSIAQRAVIIGIFASNAVIYFAAQGLGVNFRLSSAIIYAMTSSILIGSSRSIVRTAYEYSTKREKERVIIYGAG